MKLVPHLNFLGNGDNRHLLLQNCSYPIPPPPPPPSSKLFRYLKEKTAKSLSSSHEYQGWGRRQIEGWFEFCIKMLLKQKWFKSRVSNLWAVAHYQTAWPIWNWAAQTAGQQAIVPRALVRHVRKGGVRTRFSLPLLHASFPLYPARPPNYKGWELLI